MGAGGPGSRFRLPLTLPPRHCRVWVAAAPLPCRTWKEERSREMLFLGHGHGVEAASPGPAILASLT